ncbi:MAG: PEP/pyruvate-binding domain-containing protein, partial [Gammaproteobacteria bacterium]
QTLRAAIATRLAPYTNYPPDIGAVKTNLAALRDLFRNTASFTPAQKQAITNAVRVFNPQRKIRFRSSTNVEDSEHFTGAGLYDSFSGCLLDDLDGDTTGPSLCDPAEANERGVFRAIQRVYASFYNDNAFLERLRHRVDESKVGMGVLVHHSFPDEEELANGVAALRFNLSAFGTNVSGDLVTQFGATPVTNPDGSASPEVVDALRYNAFNSLVFQQGSSLVPLGAYVMNWEGDYQGFMNLFTAVGYGFKQFYPAKNNFYLDFEYKKDVNLGLVVKQVREIPRPDATNQIAPFLIDEPAAHCVAQEEFGDVFANHRLKSLWTLRTASLRLAASNLTQTLYRDCELEYLSETNRQSLTGPTATWPNATSTFDGTAEHDSWTTGNGNARRLWQLETPLTLTVTGSRPPIFTQQDFRRTVTVHYARPVPTLDFQDNPTTTTDETVLLVPCPQLHPGAILRQQIFTGTNAANGRLVTVDTTYYWPRPPRGVVAGYTAPLIQFVETRLTGLTTNALVLRGYYSQTYRPGHHNFSEEFIFEPRLEPGLSPSTLAELSAAIVQFLHVHWHGEDRVTFTVFRLDGSIRRW